LYLRSSPERKCSAYAGGAGAHSGCGNLQRSADSDYVRSPHDLLHDRRNWTHDHSTVYTAPITVSVSEVVKAIGIAPGFKLSPVRVNSYHLVPAAPVFSAAQGTYGPAPFMVILTDTMPGVSFFYKTDGSVPTSASILYTGPITITSTQFLRAIAVETGYGNSAASAATYTFTAPTLVVSPAGQDFTGSITATITDADPMATIYYTFAGNKPEATSLLYTGPITVTRSEVIQAIAVCP
jgi:hypothetical protein